MQPGFGNQSMECNRHCFRRAKPGELDDAETTNGDCPGCTSSNPSPERFDEALCGESPLEKSIAGPEK
jgi:hypothetical protein